MEPRRHEDTKPVRVFFVFSWPALECWLCFSIGEEMGVDEGVDDGLVGGLDLLELDAHADPAVAPGHTALGVDIALRPRHAETHFDLRGAVEGARRANRDAAVAQVQRE